MPPVRLELTEESWPIAGRFVIARGAKTEARVIHVRLHQEGQAGQAESVPYGRYGETPASVLEQIETVRDRIEAGLDRAALQSLLPAGAARNVLDCALWDLKAKQTGIPAWQMAGLAALKPLTTAYTLSLDTPEAMGQQAALAAFRPLLKLKIGGPDDLDRIEAVRRNAPQSRLIVDANEGLNIDSLRRILPDCARLGVDLMEQPLPAAEDAELEGLDTPVPLCADESVHTRYELASISRRYQALNVKLDKSGGLTEAMALTRQARSLGMTVMAGCMVGTSLAMAPAFLFAQHAQVIDLDGPLLLKQDRQPGLVYDGSVIFPPQADLWG